jgi:hypothetical protein
MEKQYEKIAVLENQFQAQELSHILESEEIPHYIHSYHDLAYDGLFQYSKGWGHVEAPPEFREKIIEILDSLKTDESD